ncbi:MAG: hypothetical protein Q9159_004115 [Coniocarpon cinnabarinum]
MDLLHSTTFAAHVKDLLQKYHIPGLTIALVQNDYISTLAFGLASQDPSVPCEIDTLFDIASCSKSLTAAAVALLVDDNEHFPEVQWDTPMSRLLPGEFMMNQQSYTDNVTVEDILSHRSGLPPHSAAVSTTDTPSAITHKLRHLPLIAPLRTKYLYNNNLYTVATHLIETKTHQSFLDFLSQRFFQPLGMTCTFLQPSRARASAMGAKMAKGHVWDKEREVTKTFDAFDCPEGQGNGSIVTTAADYAKWARALLRAGEDGNIITKGVWEGMTTARIALPSAQSAPDAKDKTKSDPTEGNSETGDVMEQADQPPDVSELEGHYALGLEVHPYRDTQIISHDGGITGFGSTHFLLPSHKFGGVILGNASDAVISNMLAHELIDEVLGVPADERPDWVKKYDDMSKEGEVPDDMEEERQIREKLGVSQHRQGKAGGVSRGDEEMEEEKEKGGEIELGSYVGRYRHEGYGITEVEMRDGALFINHADWSEPVTLTFSPVLRRTVRQVVRQSPDDSEVETQQDPNTIQQKSRSGAHADIYPATEETSRQESHVATHQITRHDLIAYIHDALEGGNEPMRAAFEFEIEVPHPPSVDEVSLNDFRNHKGTASDAAQVMDDILTPDDTRAIDDSNADMTAAFDNAQAVRNTRAVDNDQAPDRFPAVDSTHAVGNTQNIVQDRSSARYESSEQEVEPRLGHETANKLESVTEIVGVVTNEREYEVGIKAARIGLHWEIEMDELIWFERI